MLRPLVVKIASVGKRLAAVNSELDNLLAEGMRKTDACDCRCVTKHTDEG